MISQDYIIIRGLRQNNLQNVSLDIPKGNYNFYNRLGFRTSSEYNIFPTSGYPMEEPRRMMCQETYEGSLDGIHGYIVYDMYFNA